MTYIDSVILSLTERSCRRFQLLTGRTNVWLAVQFTNLSIVVYFVWARMYAWNSDVARRILVALFCSGLLYELTQTIFKEPIEAYETDAYRRVCEGLHIVLLSYALIVLTTVVLYLLACDPLPPCAGKVRDWLRLGRFAAIRPVNDGQP